MDDETLDELLRRSAPRPSDSASAGRPSWAASSWSSVPAKPSVPV